MLSFFSLQAQKKTGCSREKAMDAVGELKEITADVAKYKNTKEEIVFDIDEETYGGKDYFVISEMQTNAFHYSTWSIFYVDKKNCTVYNYDKEKGKLLTVDVWRYKNSLNDKSIDRKIVFTDVFNEGTIIRFGPKDLDKNTPEIQAFKKKLKALELKYLVVEDFNIENLTYLINNSNFFDSQHYTNSGWLQYFISKYKIDVLALNELIYTTRRFRCS